MSTTSTSHPTTRTARTIPAPLSRPGRALRSRGGRRLLAPLAGIAFAAVLVAGCGAEEPADPEETAAQETQEEAPPGEDDTDDGDDDGTGESTGEGTDGDGDDGTGGDGDDGTGGDGGTEDPEDPEDGDPEGPEDGTEGPGDDPDDGTEDPDDGTDDPSDDPDDGTEDPGDEDPGDDENLFEGSWHFGHDQKVLSAEELAALVEQEALDRGPDEMHLTVECSDGVDTGAGDTEADCVAIADEGVEHPWLITALPADAGLEVEVENVG